MNENQARGISNSPWVQAVYQDSQLPVSEMLSNQPHCFPEISSGCFPPGDWGVDTRTFTDFPQSIECQNPDPSESGCNDNWGLDRLDGFSVIRDGTFDANSRGSGVDVYVIDTGVFKEHSAFGGRVIEPYHNSTFDENGCKDCQPACFPPCGTDVHDYWGHGTHVAGIIGGSITGVAKDVWIHPVRIVDNSCGPIEVNALVDALDWIELTHSPSMPTALVNLSLNNPDYLSHSDFEPVRMSLRSLASRSNILLVQSAGNGSADACAWIFESTQDVLIVGGSDEDDGRWVCEESTDSNCDFGSSGVTARNSGSNLGSCVDIFAPAAHIVSVYPADGGPDSEMAVCRSSGTSMAAPHVVGVAALLLEQEPGLSATQLRSRLLSASRSGVLDNQSTSSNYIGDGSPDLLLHFNDHDLFEDDFESGDFKPWSSKSP